MEQAGGLATDGNQDILSIKVENVNQLSPVYIGSVTGSANGKKILIIVHIARSNYDLRRQEAITK